MSIVCRGIAPIQRHTRVPKTRRVAPTLPNRHPLCFDLIDKVLTEVGHIKEQEKQKQLHSDLLDEINCIDEDHGNPEDWDEHFGGKDHPDREFGIGPEDPEIAAYQAITFLPAFFGNDYGKIINWREYTEARYEDHIYMWQDDMNCENCGCETYGQEYCQTCAPENYEPWIVFPHRCQKPQ